ncbi:hypothetical protein [Chitinophaga sancti]|uniref:Uncharacterized protein n=1 Tax=Chitinophaga sancti TaxID=1004 RepID=A0A1K1T437_9BACT|nr:hypothetical protein [Chitinophaga sancti]WQD61454.1 hypothetical protein U0033_26615 [Chitinophaga sancti]WQG92989.1 hypothetical protein SR876_15825 [Chitinophaga sancti]SFW91336.1 hypothetical protein SAMN05661012_06766 [Chitinophaga sancti]
MLLLDLSKQSNELILNVTPLITSDTPELFMRVKTQFDFKEVVFPLGVNMSLFPKRYDSFIIVSSFLQGLNEGLGLYEIFEDVEQEKILEIGLVTIKNPIIEPDTNFVSLPDEDETKPTFKVYVKR